MASPNTNSLDNQILSMIEYIGSEGAFPLGIPLPIIYARVKASGLLNNDWSIRKHLKNLECRGEIAVDEWKVRMLNK